jgi:nickel/cobalt exporter
MNEFLSVIAMAGFSVAFLHAAIPTHWLPFVAVGRAQHWSRRKTLTVTAVTGLGHVSSTALLGVLLVWLGIVVDKRLGAMFPIVAGGVLILMGLLYLRRYATGKGHSHFSLFGGHAHPNDHEHPHDHDHHHSHGHPHDHGHSHDHEVKCSASAAPVVGTLPPATSDWAAISGLFALLTFSPCEGFLPIYASGIRYGWSGFALLTLVLSVATIAGNGFLHLVDFDRRGTHQVESGGGV